MESALESQKESDLDRSEGRNTSVNSYFSPLQAMTKALPSKGGDLPRQQCYVGKNAYRINDDVVQ